MTMYKDPFKLNSSGMSVFSSGLHLPDMVDLGGRKGLRVDLAGKSPGLRGPWAGTPLSSLFCLMSSWVPEAGLASPHPNKTLILLGDPGLCWMWGWELLVPWGLLEKPFHAFSGPFPVKA